MGEARFFLDRAFSLTLGLLIYKDNFIWYNLKIY